MISETKGCLQVQVPAKGGGFGANYVPTRVCNISGLEKPQTRVCGRVSKVERKKGPLQSLQPITYHHMFTGTTQKLTQYKNNYNYQEEVSHKSVLIQKSFRGHYSDRYRLIKNTAKEQQHQYISKSLQDSISV